MPRIFLSPSTQEWNSYVTPGKNEQLVMNRLADAMNPIFAQMALTLSVMTRIEMSEVQLPIPTREHSMSISHFIPTPTVQTSAHGQTRQSTGAA